MAELKIRQRKDQRNVCQEAYVLRGKRGDEAGITLAIQSGGAGWGWNDGLVKLPARGYDFRPYNGPNKDVVDQSMLVTAPINMTSLPKFGPVVERVVTNEIDLDTGSLKPEELKGSDHYSDALYEDPVFVFSAGTERIQLTGPDWDGLSPERLRAALSKRVNPSDITFNKNITKLPVTLGFRTGSGRIGMLQITGFTDNPRGVKIRYKLVSRPALSAPITSGQAGSAANPIYVRCDKGETEAVLPHGGRLRLLAIGDQQHWWTPQGQPLPENPEWQRFRKNLPDSNYIAVVAQLHPEIDPAVAKIGPDGEQHLALSAFGISSEPGKRESLIVGFGTGPWQTAPTVLSPAQPGVIKFGEAICGVEKIEEQIAGTPSYAPMTLVSFWLTQPSEVESALVAVGKDGREEALGLTWLAVGAARALPPGQRWDTSGFAHLDLARLELRIRPRAWAGFVGFATQPHGHRVELEQPNRTSAAAAARFAPVVEVVLNDLDDGQGNEALHLQTGTLSSVPAEAKSVGGVLTIGSRPTTWTCWPITPATAGRCSA